MITRPVSSIRAALEGLALILNAPGLLAGVLLLTMAAALPFVFAVEAPVMRSLAMQPPVDSIAASEIDAEWWQEFSRHAGGLAATFTPAILGFAAPLDSVSALLDATPRPFALLWPVTASALLWAFLWGGVLHRCATGEDSLRGFWSAALRHFRSMAAVTLMAAAASVLLYLTLHALLFGVIYQQLAPRLAAERDAFLLRVACYLIFGIVLVLANAVFSFARVCVVSGLSAGHAIARAWLLTRRRIGAVLGLYAIYLALFAAAMIGYGAIELMGGAAVGGWRAVVVGQVFVVVRLALRLGLAASQVRLADAPRHG